jgi:hypothetical protein
MRTKFFSYIVDNLGNAIDGARIHVLVYPLGGGVTSYASIYLTDASAVTTSFASEILTDENGYFEFYVADLEEGGVNGYEYQREFKITWSGGGAVSGSIDKLQLFDVTKREVDTTGTGTNKNRLVSNILAKEWQEHRTSAALDEHTQYLKTDGSRALTGIWDTGASYPILSNLIKARPSSDLVLGNYSGIGLTIDKTTGKVTIANLEAGTAFTLNGTFTGVGSLLSWTGNATFASGTLTASIVDINSGAIDNTAIGAAAPSTGKFTTLLTTSLTTTGAVVIGSTLNVTAGILTASNVAITGGTITGATINNTPIGQTLPAPGNFTTLICTSLIGNISGGDTTVESLYTKSVYTGTLTTSGNTILGDTAGDSITINGISVIIPNDINISSGLMYLNSSNNRITIGGTAADRKLEVIDTSTQLRLTYSTGIYAEFGCNNLGNLTMTSSALSASCTLDLVPSVDNTYNLGCASKRWKDLYMTGLLDIDNDSLRIRSSATPATTAATGVEGQISWDTEYIYICIETDHWHRISHSDW